jgi:uncharacterized membrane protein
MKPTLLTLSAMAFALGTFAPKASAQDAPVDFEKQILPILDAKCISCHAKEHEDGGRIKKPKSGLALDSAAAILKGGKAEPEKTVIAGKPDESWLLKTLLLPEDDDLFMPPKGDHVTPEEQALIKKWIEQGANFGAWKGKE